MIDKMHEMFNRVASPYLSGLRRNHSCQSVLTRLIQNSKDALDAGRVYGILITDLSKAVDCLPHRLLIAKLRVYGPDESACKLVSSYFTGRMQRMKVVGSRNDWRVMSKGTPQGSILGPFIFNMFIK